MSEFRRNLLKMGGVNNTERFIRRHLLCWFSPSRQGATNESLAADPRLVDLSGKGNDLMLTGPTYTAGTGLSAEGALKIFYPTDYGRTNDLKALKKFTVITDRWRRGGTKGACVARKGDAFGLEATDYGNRNVVFGHTVLQSKSSFDYVRKTVVLIPTAKWDYGSEERDIINPGFKGDTVSPLQIGTKFYANGEISADIYEFMLFDCVLTDDQITWAVENLMQRTE